MPRITTNQILNPSIKLAEFYRRYEVFSVATTKGKGVQSRLSSLLDMHFEHKSICSIFYEGSHKFYMLLESSPDNLPMIRKVVADCPSDIEETLSYQKETCLESHVILNLLLNALANPVVGDFRYNNLSGKLLLIDPKQGLAKNGSEKKRKIDQIHALEVSISPKLLVLLKVVTFTNIKHRDLMNFPEGKTIYSHAWYEIIMTRDAVKKATRKKEMNDSDQNTYIQRQVSNERYRQDFIVFDDKNQFELSKMGMLEGILRKFKQRYHDIVTLDLDCIEEYESLSNQHIVKRYDESLSRILSSLPLHIVDYCETEKCYLTNFVNVSNEILKDYDAELSITDTIDKDTLTICVIRNQDYYKKLKYDDMHKVYPDRAVQHITYDLIAREKLSTRAVKPLLKSILNQLIIKHDILGGHVSLYGWSSLSLPQALEFGIRHDDGHFDLIRVEPDGAFSFKKITLLDIETYTELDTKYRKLSYTKRTIRGLIRDDRGNYCFILDTDWITIPEIEAIHAKLEETTQIRGKWYKENFYPSSIKVCHFVHPVEQKHYYFAGGMENMKQSLPCASHIRELVFEGKNLMADIYDTMNVPFVKNGQLTIRPFPFKYLEEYLHKG